MLATETKEALSALRDLLPAERVSIKESDRLAYSRDQWPRTLLAVRDERPVIAPPDIVVWPESTREVAEIVRLAGRLQLPIVPWGAGSGVCGGAMAIKGGITLDLKRMAAVLDVSNVDHLARFQSGILGQILEDQLNLRGLTLGHFPSSIYCSTLGGWLAARSAGQLSSRYGKIEDMVESMEVVLGDGRVIRTRSGEFPDIQQLVVGSEGTLGVITEAEMRVCDLPACRIFRAYEFPRVAAGCEGIRRMMQSGLRPSVVRLYDELDTLVAQFGGSKGNRSPLMSLLELVPERLERSGRGLRDSLLRAALSRAGLLSKLVEKVVPRLSGGCLMILGVEGDQALTQAEAGLCHAELVAAGGKDIGEEPGLRWFEHRYAISYKQSPLFVSGGFVDTMEVATTWSQLLELYSEVRKTIGELAVVMAHFSHSYPEGCSIYFTFTAAAADRERSEQLYDEIWRRGLAAVVRSGGTISHHHGVGYSKAGFMSEEHGEGLDVQRQIKQVLDPLQILNPGKMGL